MTYAIKNLTNNTLGEYVFDSKEDAAYYMDLANKIDAVTKGTISLRKIVIIDTYTTENEIA